MATGVSENTHVDMQQAELSSLRTVDDCRLRLDKIARIFNNPDTDTNDIVQLKITMSKLENLLHKETKTWWDSSTLQQYLEKDMVPRGLRIKKHPTTLYGDDFADKWNCVLSDCSKKLMELIISFESAALTDIRKEIKILQAEVTPFAHYEAFLQMDTKLKENIANMETTIMEIKKSKYMRDLQDYKSNAVYTWYKKERANTPHSIFKRTNRKRKPTTSRVNFDSTEPDTSDNASDWSDHGGQNINARQNSTQATQSKQQNKNKNKQASKNGEVAENTGGTTKGMPTRNLRSTKAKS